MLGGSGLCRNISTVGGDNGHGRAVTKVRVSKGENKKKIWVEKGGKLWGWVGCSGVGKCETEPGD